MSEQHQSKWDICTINGCPCIPRSAPREERCEMSGLCAVHQQQHWLTPGSIFLESGEIPKIKIYLGLLVSVDFLQIKLLEGFFPAAPLLRWLPKFRIQAEDGQVNADEVLSFSCIPAYYHSHQLSLLTPDHPSLTTSSIKLKTHYKITSERTVTSSVGANEDSHSSH